jgi:hypothetical protein
MKIVLYSVGALFAVLALCFVLRAFGVFQFSVFGPMEQNIRREVFENTNSYNRGKIQELAKYRLEYLKTSDDTVRRAVAATIRSQFADYPAKRIEDPELREFLKNIKGGM